MTYTLFKDIWEIIQGVGIDNLSEFEGKEILITGGSGFLGSWFIAVLSYLNKEIFTNPCLVYVMDSMIAADKPNSLMTPEELKDSNIRWVEADISQYKLDGKIDFIIHAAGIASPIYYRKFPIETIDGMVLGLSNLLKFAAKTGVESFLCFSSSEAYGNPYPEFVPTKEDYNGNVSMIGPRSCYDESKRMEEAMCVAYHNIHKVPVKWVRPFNVYGPGMRVKDDRVVPKFIFQILRGEPITVHVPGTQTRTFCYITDAMIGFFKTLLSKKQGEVYNIGNPDDELSMYDLAFKMREAIGASVNIEQVEMPPEYPRDQAQRRCPDITKAKDNLSYFPKVSLLEGIKRSYAWGKEEILK
jgi:UDP-glucuronate decarboxylase